MSKDLFDSFRESLDKDVADGSEMLFQWYREVQEKFQTGLLTKLEMKKLFQMGKGFEV